MYRTFIYVAFIYVALLIAHLCSFLCYAVFYVMALVMLWLWLCCGFGYVVALALWRQSTPNKKYSECHDFTLSQ